MVDPQTGKKTNKLPTGKVLSQALLHCRQYDAPIPELIVAAGAVPWQALNGPGTITDWRGFKHPHAPVIATLHPADLFRDPKMRLPVMLDWLKVRKYREGAWPQAIPPYHAIRSDSFNTFLQFCDTAHSASAPWLVVDTEYDPQSKYLLVIGLTYPGAPYGVQIWMADLDANLRRTLRANLLDLFRRYRVVFHNAMADIPVLDKNLSIDYRDYRMGVDDTMLLHAVLWSDWPHTLEFLASVYGVHPKMKHLSQSDPSLYNWGDVCDTASAMSALTDEAKRDPLSRGVYETQSLPLVPIILKRSVRGIRVNTHRVAPAYAEYTEQMNGAQELARAGCGYPINIGSDDQLKAYLYDFKDYPVQKHKDTKQPTTNGDAIAALRTLIGPQPDLEDEDRNGLSIASAISRIERGADPILEARVAFAAAEQTVSHYLRPLHDVDRIYPEYKIHAQASGRWSITNPPLGQLPDDLRDIICPDDGEAWISYDSDQIELRLLAALAQDTPYLTAFDNNWDVHTINACAIFDLPKPDSFDLVNFDTLNRAWISTTGWLGKQDPRRVFAKRFVYRLNYGGYAGNAGDIPGAKQLGLDKHRLVAASNRYLAEHPAMLAWREGVAREVHTTSVSRTFTGRRRRLLGKGASALREAYNHPLQGGAADVLNITTIRIANALPYATIVYTMHDSATWTVPAERAQEAQTVIQGIVDEPWDIAGLKVKLPVKFNKIKYAL
jgi:DNA polymerase I-like protein with 3'-5' exonuclease and polymerase domains